MKIQIVKFLMVFTLSCSLVMPLNVVWAEEADAAAEAAESEEALGYKIAPGDKVEIKVYREEDLSGIFEVDNDGAVTYPLIGKFKVEGATPSDLQTWLTEQLKRYLVDPQLSIVKETSSQLSAVSILGHVKRPNTFEIEPGMTLMRVISMAAGFAPSANKKKVRIVRTVTGTKEVIIVNADDVVNGKTADVEVKSGDMIFVPESVF